MCAVPIAAQGYLGIRKEESFASGGDVVNYIPIFIILMSLLLYYM